MLFVLTLSAVAMAQPIPPAPDRSLADPAAEARAQALMRELRCVVCQGQSIGDSNAELAADMRRLVRERIAAGDSDARVREWFRARYGDFVLLDPPFGATTWLLWLAPPVVLLVGAIGVALWLRRRKPSGHEASTLDAAEEARLARLVDRAD
ncbi:MAG: cytochrome c-type biogenesis protein CcmH [Alphaproteobacteria bacterium]|nr:cytochrome c-type biogenesis protein CcmH [Alphaproteobacteria bacterium]